MGIIKGREEKQQNSPSNNSGYSNNTNTFEKSSPIERTSTPVHNFVTFRSGNTYSGWMLNGVPHGEGTYIWVDDGTIYKGDFVDGKRDGYGVMEWPDGEKYEGYWKNEELNGLGTYTWPGGTYYKGYWKNGLRDGRGEMVYKPDVTLLMGTWRKDHLISGRCLYRAGFERKPDSSIDGRLCPEYR
ncbi:MAG TPA: hypothetical protein PLK85_06650 [Alphaproteobacteria bacterium]|nr:hypothetical protein [Alphaproteobacteria bacterium]